MALAEFLADAARAADAVRSAPATTRWLVACDADSDGLCGGAVVAQALRKAGGRFTVRASRDKTEAAYRAILAEPAEGIVLVDKGSSHVDLLGELATASGKRVVVLDHHNVPTEPPASLVLVNPRRAGLDGSREASASTTAAAFALALCGDAAFAWAPTALAGAVGDRQDEGGWRGWNLELARRARAAGHLLSRPMPRLRGDLARALAALDPPVPGLAGDEAASGKLLQELGIERDDDVEELDAERRTRLVSALVLRQLAAGQVPAEAAGLVEDRDLHALLGLTLGQVHRRADACGREGHGATAIAFLLGDRAARADAEESLRRDRRTLQDAVRQAVQRGVAARAAFQLAEAPHASHSGLVAERLLESGVAGAGLPVVVLAPRDPGLLQVSARGTHALVAAGLDLGRALAAAAASAQGEGGGHPVAAGAVVPASARNAFLEALDREFLSQPFVARAA